MVFALARQTFLAVLIGGGSLHAQSPLNEARSTLEKWVEARQLISKTRSDWQSDKDMLEQSVALLERELKSVEEQMTKVSTHSVHVEKERIQGESLLKSSNESVDRAKAFASDFEGKILKFAPQLPLPLQEIIKPFLVRVPANPENTKMPATERIQVVVGLLNEWDKFNNAVTLFSEKRKNSKGDEVAVETVYVGLGAAYFVNDSGDYAGTGAPGPKGWEWTFRPDLSVPVRDVIRIYRNEKPAYFIPLPVSIK